MEIELGKFTLTSDKRNFIITPTKKLKQARTLDLTAKTPRKVSQIHVDKHSHYFDKIIEV